MSWRNLTGVSRWPSLAQARPFLPVSRAHVLPYTPQFHLSLSSRQSAAAPSAENDQIRIDRKLRMTFTCTAPACTKPGVRSTHEFSRLAYEKGIVLVQCPGCKTRHLIADHLGWFDADDLTQGGKYRNIEDLLKAKGEEVIRGTCLVDQTELNGKGGQGETLSFVPPDTK